MVCIAFSSKLQREGTIESKILLVEDDVTFIQAVTRAAGKKFTVVPAKTGVEGFRLFSQAKTPFDVIVLDYHLPDFNGDDLATMIHKRLPRQEILFATQDATAAALTALLQNGCGTGFVQKGGGPAELMQPIEAAIGRYRNEKMLIDPSMAIEPTEIESDLLSIGMVGRSKVMHEVFRTTNLYKNEDIDVIIFGETGTGKELIARGLAAGNFFPLNCGRFAQNEQLMESELFGHVKGAYTDAKQDRPGIFELANNGTIFLDEINTLSDTAQMRLLRVLQERKIKRVGESFEREVALKFKLIVGAKPNLPQLVDDGRFSPDLYYRMRKGRIFVPPLSERTEDIEPLVRHFTGLYMRKHKRIKYIESACIRAMEKLTWKGNVRDLESCVESLVLHSSKEVIALADLQRYMALEKSHLNTVSNPAETIDFAFFRESMDSNYIISQLTKSYTVGEAADRLKMPRTTLNSRLKRFNIIADEHLLTRKRG